MYSLIHIYYCEGNIMSKSFDIIMAGLIAGLVALTSGFLGVAGTVIGAVFGAILYQVLSIFVKEPLENTTVKKVEREIVYIIPLGLIAVFLVIFLVALLYSYSIYYPDFLELFRQLEETTNDNLLRFMGIGLIAMGIYPLLQPNTIKRKYGVTILALGFVLLVRGLLDMNPDLLHIYADMFGYFDVILTVIILLILVFVIIKILLGSVSLYRHRNKDLGIDLVNKKITKNKVFDGFDNFDEFSISDPSDNVNEDKNFADKKPVRNKTIKSNKTSTMSKNRRFFKR